MSDEPRDATPEEIAQEQALQHFEAQVVFRQSNILPMDSALNVGMFYGLLIRAKRPRNSIERIEFWVMGILWTGSVIAPSPLSAVYFLIGLKLIWTACKRTTREVD